MRRTNVVVDEKELEIYKCEKRRAKETLEAKKRWNKFDGTSKIFKLALQIAISYLPLSLSRRSNQLVSADFLRDTINNFSTP